MQFSIDMKYIRYYWLLLPLIYLFILLFFFPSFIALYVLVCSFIRFASSNWWNAIKRHSLFNAHSSVYLLIHQLMLYSSYECNLDTKLIQTQSMYFLHNKMFIVILRKTKISSNSIGSSSDGVLVIWTIFFLYFHSTYLYSYNIIQEKFNGISLFLWMLQHTIPSQSI